MSKTLFSPNFSVQDQSYEISNLSLSCSVGSNALTIAVKDKSGADASSGSPIKVGMRSSTVTSGVYNQRTISAALSLVISSGSTLGHVSSANNYIWVYLLDNSGTLELAVSSVRYDENSVISTTAEGGAGNADSAFAIYSTTARSNVPIRLIGRLKSNQTTAGTWTAVPTEISVNINDFPRVVAKSGAVGIGDDYIISASCGTFTSASGSFTDITNLSITVTTNGLRPIFIGLMNDGTTAGFISAASTTTDTNCNADFLLVKDGSGVTRYTLQSQDTGVGATSTLAIPATSIWYVDFPAAGTYVYKMQVALVAGDTAGCSNARLMAINL